MITIYGGLDNRGFRIAWACEEVDAQYVLKHVELSKGEHLQESYAKINPFQKVPSIEHNGFYLSESGAILNYLGDTFRESAELTPVCGSKKRALYDQFMYFFVSEMEAPIWVKAKHSFVYPEAKRVPLIKQRCEEEFLGACKRISNVLKNRPYLLGQDFTMADLTLGYLLLWAGQANLTPDDKVLANYQASILQRPAMQKLLEQKAIESKRSS